VASPPQDFRVVGPPSDMGARAASHRPRVAIEIDMSYRPDQQPSQSTTPYSSTSQVVASPVAKETPAGTEAGRPSRVVVCGVAACLAAFVALEPLVIDAHPGLQVFHTVSLIWFWALFMFGGASN
jgi:hypothetical protein